MTNYPTLLGMEPRETGLVRGTQPIIPPRVVIEPLQKKESITLGDEKLYRFPLIARVEIFSSRGKQKLRGSYYRWMLYALPHDSDVDLIEAELTELNKLRDARNECQFPLLVADLSNLHYRCPFLGGQHVAIAPAFVRAQRMISE